MDIAEVVWQGILDHLPQTIIIFIVIIIVILFFFWAIINIVVKSINKQNKIMLDAVKGAYEETLRQNASTIESLVQFLDSR